jgi:hypothetical protein
LQPLPKPTQTRAATSATRFPSCIARVSPGLPGRASAAQPHQNVAFTEVVYTPIDSTFSVSLMIE